MRGWNNAIVALPDGRLAMGISSTAVVTGFANPLPVAVSPDGGVLVGDWASGKIYRIARV